MGVGQTCEPALKILRGTEPWKVRSPERLGWWFIADHPFERKVVGFAELMIDVHDALIVVISRRFGISVVDAGTGDLRGRNHIVSIRQLEIENRQRDGIDVGA